MNPALSPVALVFGGCIILATTVAMLLHPIIFRYPMLLRMRLHELSGKRQCHQLSELVNTQRLVESEKSANNWRSWTSDLVRQAGLKIDARTLATVSVCSGGVVAACVQLAARQWRFAVIAFVIGFVTPFYYVWLKRRARFRKMTLQLPDALDFLCRAVRAGQTVSASFQMVGDDFPAPISDEFRHCYEQQNLGISYASALRNLAQSCGIVELRILVVALLVQSRSGGNLTDLLENLANMLRKRIAMQHRVKAITGEGRMQAIVLIALPIIVFLAMYVLNRDYAEILIDRPWILAGCGVSQSIGAALIYKFIQIDY